MKLRGKGFASGVPIAGRVKVANTRLVVNSRGLVSGTPLPGRVHAATVRLAARSQSLLARLIMHIALLLYGIITDLGRSGTSHALYLSLRKHFSLTLYFFTLQLLL